MRPLRLILVLWVALSAHLPMRAAVEPAPMVDTLGRGSTLVDSLLRDAISYVGVRYRYGASGEAGFDCTGFTSFIFRKYGYMLERSSPGQARQGVAVKRDSLLPGDIVVFSGRRISKHRPGHVGIVVSVDRSTGDFSFIHACSRGVLISRFAAERYYVQRYIAARRILPPEAYFHAAFSPVLSQRIISDGHLRSAPPLRTAQLVRVPLATLRKRR